MSKAIDHLLRSMDIRPVLVDIGASGSSPKIWEMIAKHSVYVGFDPDMRDLHEVPQSRFHKEIILNKAITSDKGNEEVLFYLTKSPHCSSTLKPDSESLANFLFSDLFVVEKEVKVPAATLDVVMERLSLPCIDWLKTDSQGTDLRIFNSLRDEVRSRVLAVDIEPGLIDAYVGEDLFVDAHRYLTQNGFWLSDLEVCGSIRMRRSSLPEVMAINKNINYEFLTKTVKQSPGWCEARYFRTIQWLAEGDFSKREYVLLWIFALLDSQFGFAIDLGIEYERVFGKDDISQLMKDEPILRMRQSPGKRLLAIAKSLLPARVKRWLKESIR